MLKLKIENKDWVILIDKQVECFSLLQDKVKYCIDRLWYEIPLHSGYKIYRDNIDLEIQKIKHRERSKLRTVMINKIKREEKYKNICI